MAKRNTRSRQQAEQRALTRLLLAQVAEMISRPGPLAAALQARFAQTSVTPESPAVASVSLDLLPDGCVCIVSTCKGRPDSLYAPLADAMVPREVEKLLVELRERLRCDPRQMHVADIDRAGAEWAAFGAITESSLHCGSQGLDVVNETRRTTLLLQACCLELKAQMLQRPASEDELSAAYAQAAWRPARELQRDLRTAGALVARVFGESVGPYEPVGFLDGESEPQTLDEAFVLLRRLAERSGLSPMGVLKAFVAGNLAATSLSSSFPGLRSSDAKVARG